MKGIDTNILVRFLVGDDVQQARIVYRLFKEAESSSTPLFVPVVVVLELIWVLESVYEVGREEILDAINDLLLMSSLKFEHPSAIQKFVLNARKNSVDL